MVVILLRIFSIVLIVLGGLIVYFAGFFVNKFNLVDKVEREYEEELTKKELEDYKLNHSLIKVKLIGLIIFLPGALVAFFAFK